MAWLNKYESDEMEVLVRELFREQRSLKRLDGWFRIKEIEMNHAEELKSYHPEVQAAKRLEAVIQELPLNISDAAIFAGTQNDAFARSYALINPSFTVEGFEGYCDPVAVFGDIEPNDEFPVERIQKVKAYLETTDYVRELKKVYSSCEEDTAEVAYFVEQVTGHTIADFRPVLAEGVDGLILKIQEKMKACSDEQYPVYEGMIIALRSAVLLAERYADIAAAKAAQCADTRRKAQWLQLQDTLRHVPRKPARGLFDAMQAYLLFWQIMCIEQAPNPFAFSAGNLDRVFEPYRAMDDASREKAAGLFKHFLLFFNVADRSWAISQNIIVGGKSSEGQDLTNPMTYSILDAYYECNFPQPILSVKLHRQTPDELYEDLGRFFFSPGVLTPSLFNDDTMFEMLKMTGVEQADLEDYSIAGCQEPLIMGKDSANTTNSWLNLAKVLELTLNNGKSAITGKQIGLTYEQLGLDGTSENLLNNLRGAFWKQLDHFTGRMVESANGCSKALANLPIPFLSANMGCIESGIDMRDAGRQGTKYNGSGCLIHGLSVVSDSFVAVDEFMRSRPEDSASLLEAIQNDYKGHDSIREFLASCPKYGNANVTADNEAAVLADKVCNLLSEQKNYLGNSFKPDWSSPTTHLLYGYWVGATPDGRKSRDQLGYGIDPLYGEANSGLGNRVASQAALPYYKMTGGCASHFGINPAHFPEQQMPEKGMAFKERVVQPYFFGKDEQNPFYLYVNVSTPETLRKVLADPQKYAPSGVYIMRIHGTFVNFLDLSPHIQEDIITRLDLDSTAIG